MKNRKNNNSCNNNNSNSSNNNNNGITIGIYNNDNETDATPRFAATRRASAWVECQGALQVSWVCKICKGKGAREGGGRQVALRGSMRN